MPRFRRWRRDPFRALKRFVAVQVANAANGVNQANRANPATCSAGIDSSGTDSSGTDSWRSSTSDDARTAIDGNRLPSDVAGGITGQKDHGALQILFAANAPQGRAGHQRIGKFFDQRVGHF